MFSTHPRSFSFLGLISGAVGACSAEPAPHREARSPSSAPTVIAAPAESASTPASSVASAPPVATEAESEAKPEAELAPTVGRPCPDGMQHVKTAFCPDMKRECLHGEYDPSNRITICHRFREAKGTCLAPRVPLDYCIDEYEFPNRRGEKPPVMVSFYDAEARCAEVGKRVCRESEWVAACEGPEETPFPTGFRREPETCNFDNKWVSPILERVYSSDPEVRAAELARLDRSVPSGARPGCKSGFGVFDLTGNVDEWVRADQERARRSRFAALKGGAWGHVRNACRPVTTSHPPDFKYYFIGFRCCRDVTST